MGIDTLSGSEFAIADIFAVSYVVVNVNVVSSRRCTLRLSNAQCRRSPRTDRGFARRPLVWGLALAAFWHA